jgi:2-amino-4-hydroxy-6-hydroxymethyldihydropteridine diphosphokinase
LRALPASWGGVFASSPRPAPQPDYLNATVLIDTEVHPLHVLAICRGIEADAGRNRTEQSDRWGPRPLDLDLLLAEGIVIASPALTLPHSQLADRRFVLLPAAELVPQWLHPHLHRTIAELAAAADPAGQRCERAGAFPPAPPPG